AGAASLWHEAAAGSGAAAAGALQHDAASDADEDVLQQLPESASGRVVWAVVAVVVCSLHISASPCSLCEWVGEGYVRS
ncbi:MAG: hypothetical protein QM602_08570, partial [Microbacterium sp.]